MGEFPPDAAGPLIIGAVVLVLCYFLTRLIRHWESTRGSDQRREIAWLGTYSQGFQRSLDIMGAIPAQVVSADPNRGTITARTGLTLLSYGATVNVHLQTIEGVTTVFVEPAPSASVYDWGESRRLVSRFLEIWDRLPEPES
jgi:hypothetical protein